MDNSYGDALAWAEQKLNEQGIATAHLDSLVLLEDVLGVDRAHILSEPQTSITEALMRQYKVKVRARAKHLPLAYIRGKSEFYGHEFMVNRYVLEPRPESEALIVEFMRLTDKNPDLNTVIDIGTGSGALIISAKLERPRVKAMAVDIDAKCLIVAKANAAQYHQDISFYLGNLIKPIPQVTWENTKSQVVILANLPYVPDDWQINRSAAHEPIRAIFGGPDGLSLYRELFKQLGDLNNPPIFVLTESMPPQHQSLAALAANAGYKLTLTNDFVQVFKFKTA